MPFSRQSKKKQSLHGKSVQTFSDPRITYYQKALVMEKPFKVRINVIIDIPLLGKIITLFDTLYIGQAYKAAYLIAFFSFLHISNLVPHKASSYSPLRQLARADIIFCPPELHIVLKWLKTMQAKMQLQSLNFLSYHFHLCAQLMLQKVVETCTRYSRFTIILNQIQVTVAPPYRFPATKTLQGDHAKIKYVSGRNHIP